MSKKDTSYTVSKFQKEAHSERYNVRESALTKVKNGNLNGNIEKIVPTIRWIALNDCSRRVRACAIEVCKANNITVYGKPIELPTEAVEIPCNIDNIILDVFFRCKIPPSMDCFDDSRVARIINKFSSVYKNEFAIMNDIFSNKKQLVDWIKSKYPTYNEEYEKQEAIAGANSTKIEASNAYCEKMYGREQFLTDIKSRYRDVRLRAVGKAGNCPSLKTEMGEEYQNVIKNMALHDCNRDVRDLAKKIYNRNSSKQPEVNIQLPENITEIIENVFESTNIGHGAYKLGTVCYEKVNGEFKDRYPSEYRIVRLVYQSNSEFEKFLNCKLSHYHKKYMKRKIKEKEEKREERKNKQKSENSTHKEPYGTEQFLYDVKSTNHNIRINAVRMLKTKINLVDNILEFEEILKDISLNDSSILVRNEAIKVCHMYNIKCNDSIEMERLIKEIMEDVFKSLHTGIHAQKIKKSEFYDRILNRLSGKYPDEYAEIRNIYQSQEEFWNFLSQMLYCYHKQCVKERAQQKLKEKENSNSGKEQ